MLQDTYGHMVIKRLLQNLKPNSHAFSAVLYPVIADELLEHVGSNRGAFVITALLQNGDPAVSKKVHQTQPSSPFISLTHTHTHTHNPFSYNQKRGLYSVVGCSLL
jgi:hypothetical protein